MTQTRDAQSQPDDERTPCYFDRSGLEISVEQFLVHMAERGYRQVARTETSCIEVFTIWQGVVDEPVLEPPPLFETLTVWGADEPLLVATTTTEAEALAAHWRVVHSVEHGAYGGPAQQ